MKSPRGFIASIVFLSALPIAALVQLLVGSGVEAAVHIVLAVGAGLLSTAVWTFHTPRWIAWLGFVSMGGLAAIFSLQAVSDLLHSPPLAHFAFQVLGQRLEGGLLTLFLLWCIALLFVDSNGSTRVMGYFALSMAVIVRMYAYVLAAIGRSLEMEMLGLKLFYLMPFVWLVAQSGRSSASKER